MTTDDIKAKLVEESLHIAVDLIKKYEGLELKAYKCPAGVWTIGYGHIENVKSGDEISAEEACNILKNDVQKYHRCVINEVGAICNANQVGALTSFAFNVGIGIQKEVAEQMRQNGKKPAVGLLNSTLLKVIKNNPNDFDNIKKQFMQWVRGGGKVLPELVARRQMEADIYCKS